MGDEWIQVSSVRRGDMILEEDAIVLVVAVHSDRNGTRRIVLLRGDAVHEVMRQEGTFIFGETVAELRD